jgi:signal transduction histidine kinase
VSRSFDPSSCELPWPLVVRQAVHDMRTPVSSILTAAAVLRQLHGQKPSPDVERILSLLERQVETLSGQLQRLSESPESYLGTGD